MKISKTDPNVGLVRTSLIGGLDSDEEEVRGRQDENSIKKIIEGDCNSRNVFLAGVFSSVVDVRSLKIRFNPYVLSNEKVVKVKTHESDGKESKVLFLEVDFNSIPDSRLVPRKDIILPFYDEKFLRDVEKIVASLAHDWQEANEKRKQYFDFKFNRAGERNVEVKLREIEYVRKNNLFFNTQSVFRSPDLATIKQAYKQKVEKLSSRGELQLDSTENKIAEALAVYFCLDSALSPCGFFGRLPNGFLSPGSELFSLEVQAVGRYIIPRLFSDGKGNPKKSMTAKDVEDISDWTNCFSSSGLTTLGRVLPAADFLRVVYPGYLDSLYPPIRPWKVPGAKWKFFGEEEKKEMKELLTRAAKCAFVENGGLNSDGTINANVVMDTNWGEVFYKEEYGLAGAVQRCSLINNAFDLLGMAIPEFLEVYPRHKFEYSGKWQGENKLKTIDSIARFLVERKLKLLDDDGNVSVEKIKWISDWFDRFDDECGGCLGSAGLNAYDALKRVYPQQFGWGEKQIYPGGIRYDSMWEGVNGKKIFQLRFAKSFYDVILKLKEMKVLGFKNAEVKFSPESTPPLKISRKDFIALKNAYLRGDISWIRHIQAAGLEGGFKQCAKTINKAFEMMLGKLNKRTNEYGNSGIYENDIFSYDSRYHMIIRRLVEDLDDEISFSTVKINGVMEKGYGDFETGIEKSFLRRLLSTSEGDDYAAKARALYFGFVCSVQADRNHQEGSAMERMLTASVENDDSSRRMLLSGENLYMFLKMMRDDIVDNLNIDLRLKNQLKKVITCFTDLTTPIKDSREILLTAVEINKTSEKNNDLLTLMNTIFEHIYEVLTIHEIRQFRHFGSYSSFYEQAFSSVKEERESDEEYF